MPCPSHITPFNAPNDTHVGVTLHGQQRKQCKSLAQGHKSVAQLGFEPTNASGTLDAQEQSPLGKEA